MSWRLVAASNQNLERSISQNGVITVHQWVKIVTLPGSTLCIVRIQASDGNGAEVHLDSTGHLILFAAGNADSSGAGAHALSTDTWYHIAYVGPFGAGSGNVHRVFLNAVEEVTNTDWAPSGAATYSFLREASNGATYVDEKVAYTRAFPAAQDATAIAAEMNSATAVAASPIFDDPLTSVVGGWTATNSAVLSSPADDPSFGGTAVLTGTAASGTKRAHIAAGGRTIILTLTGDTWVADDGTFAAQRQNIINGIDSAQSETHGWDAEVKGKIGVSDVVRTSDTIVTITLDAEIGYFITATETITATIPATALVGAAQIVASPTFTVTPSPSVAALMVSQDGVQ